MHATELAKVALDGLLAARAGADWRALEHARQARADAAAAVGPAWEALRCAGLRIAGRHYELDRLVEGSPPGLTRPARPLRAERLDPGLLNTPSTRSASPTGRPRRLVDQDGVEVLGRADVDHPEPGSTSSGARPSSRRTSSSDACSVQPQGHHHPGHVTAARPAAAGPLDPGEDGGQGGAVDHAPAEVVVEAGPAQVLGRLEQQGPQLGRGQHRGREFLRTAATTPAATGQAAEVPPSEGYTPSRGSGCRRTGPACRGRGGPGPGRSSRPGACGCRRRRPTGRSGGSWPRRWAGPSRTGSGRRGSPGRSCRPRTGCPPRPPPGWPRSR